MELEAEEEVGLPPSYCWGLAGLTWLPTLPRVGVLEGGLRSEGRRAETTPTAEARRGLREAAAEEDEEEEAGVTAACWRRCWWCCCSWWWW